MNKKRKIIKSKNNSYSVKQPKLRGITSWIITLYSKYLGWAKKNTIKFVLSICVVLFSLIAGGEWLRVKQQKVEEIAVKPKLVTTFQVGKSGFVEVLGTVEKYNVVEIRAHSAGVVQYLTVTEGQEIAKGKMLAYISNNYQGGSVAYVQKQIAVASHQNLLDTFDKQVEIINKQRDIANAADENSDELREISNNSLSNLREQLDLNRSLLADVDDTLSTLENLPPSEETDALISSNKSLKAQLLAAVGQLDLSVNSTEVTNAEDSAIANLSDAQKELTLKQLELQEKGLHLQKEISGLNLRLAQVSESLTFPTSFISGVVQKVHVKPGDTISPGQLLVTVGGNNKIAKLVALVPKRYAKNYSYSDTSKVRVNNSEFELEPNYISSEATDGNLFSIVYSIDTEYSSDLADGEALRIKIPIGYPDTSGVVSLVPIDAIQQNNEGAYLMVVENGKAKTTEVNLGELYGQYVVILSGLDNGAQVILEKNVLEGDLVEVVPHEA